MSRVLGRARARRFYDRFGQRQDSQAFYEDPALHCLVAGGRFPEAHAVFELGCGTGRLARRLLEGELPPDARYVGVDISPAMVRIARERLAPFAPRAEVRLIEGDPPFPAPDGAFDRFVSTWVLDLLGEREIDAWLEEAWRLLRPGGLLAVASLTEGFTLSSRLVIGLWKGLFALSPRLVGGCRPLVLAPRVEGAGFRVLERHRVAPWGVAGEVVIGERGRRAGRTVPGPRRPGGGPSPGAGPSEARTGASGPIRGSKAEAQRGASGSDQVN